MNLYKWLYTKIGGRPWTYILRDLWAKFEWFWIIALVSLGYYMGQNDHDIALYMFVAFNIGYIMGHVFWGTTYIPNQRSDCD